VGNTVKIQKYVDNKELAAFLRDMAEALEKGGKDELACVEDFQKIKIAVKNEFGQIQLKAKIKPGGTCEGAEGESPETLGKPKYKHLKKRMKSSFKMLVKMIHDGQAPPKEAVESFLEDSELMVSYPGYGDEYYESYIKACEAFKAAFESGDVAKMHETIDVLVHEKSRCHAKYD
jgi:XXXCH domain-containing protein